ncbi:hypothetical protein M0R72_14335 [Candidatus Pacearchaeota archaeon]|jgi:hypothetical protein|nr:hypothetical protein [Candidatus Pacearchaeota archaeon]
MKFPEKKPGDYLEASHINDLNGVGKQLAGIRSGGNLSIHKGDFLSVGGLNRWHQYDVEVSKAQPDTEAIDKLWMIKLRFWSTAEAKWKSGTDEYKLDASDTDGSLSVGSKLIAFWNIQRGMFVPISPSSSNSWFYLVRGSIENNTVGALANPLLLNDVTCARYDPTVDPETGIPQIGPEVSICVIDSARQLGCWPGDVIQAVATDGTILLDTDTGLPPAEGHEEDESVDEYNVWEIVNRVSAQLSYAAVMGIDGVGDLESELWQYTTVTINGVEYIKVVWGDLLSEGDVIHGGEDLRVSYDPDTRRWQATATPCYND